MEKFNSRGKLLRHLALEKPNKAWGTFKSSNYIENKPRSDFGAAKVNALESLSSEVKNILQSYHVQENNDVRNEATKCFEVGEPTDDHVGEMERVEEEPIGDLKRRRKPKPESWKDNVNKRRRVLGQNYLGKKKINGVWSLVEKGERVMGNLCTKDSCIRSKTNHCDEFTEDDRRIIFETFWSSGDKHVQETFIQSIVDVVDKKVSSGINSRRQFSRSFHLKKNGLSLQVCKEMFLNTLSISHQDQLFLHEFFHIIPKAPGHYCRKDSSKIYLSSLIPTMNKLHDVYAGRCRAFGNKHFSICKFTEYFKGNNFSLFKRKKDRCNTCVGNEEGNISDIVWNEHQKRKNEAFALKEEDKLLADNRSTFVITADTEALLTAPRNNANIMFFHSRLNLHNFTFFDLKTREVLNYLWSENNGEIESNCFTTCYIDYLTKLVVAHPEVKKIVLWSDGCTYQNRCNVLSSALLTFAVQHKVEVWHKYLEVGHTHMECDSVHSNIEKAVKNATIPIKLPSDYIEVIANARKKKPGKYGVKYIETFSFFKDFKSQRKDLDPRMLSTFASCIIIMME